MQSAIVSQSLANLRPYKVVRTNGDIPQTKINFSEISIYANLPKDNCKLMVESVFRKIQENYSSGKSVEMEIPNIGVLIIRNKMAAVMFNDNLQRQTKNLSSKSLTFRQGMGEMSLTKANLSKFMQAKN